MKLIDRKIYFNPFILKQNNIHANIIIILNLLKLNLIIYFIKIHQQYLKIKCTY